MFGNFYIKSDYDEMNIVRMMLIKITFGCIFTKKKKNILIKNKIYKTDT